MEVQQQILKRDLSSYMKNRIKGLLSYLVPVNIGAFVLAYFVDQVAFAAVYNTIYGVEFTIYRAILTSLIIFAVYIIVSTFIWYLEQFGIYVLDHKWVGWALLLQSASWVLAPLGTAGFIIIYLLNNIFPAMFFIPLLTIGLALLIVRLYPNIEISEEGIFPTNLDPLVGVLSVTIALFVKGLFISLFL